MLTRDLKSLRLSNGKYDRITNPYEVMKTLIDSQFPRDKAMSAKVFAWITFTDDDTKDIKKVVALPIDIINCGSSLALKTPVIQAMMHWSKMKFHVMNTKWLDESLRELLVAFIRDIELTLRNGALYHFGHDQAILTSMTWNEYCEFALICCRMR